MDFQRYWYIVLITQAIAYYGKYRERELQSSQLEAQLAHAQLEVLKIQLEPHFLFNTLNSIAALARNDGLRCREHDAAVGGPAALLAGRRRASTKCRSAAS